MKSILQSIKPQYCELIASGKKTVEIRKTKPKIPTPFKVYIYQTKHSLIYNIYSKISDWQGKVIGEYVCNKIDKMSHCGNCSNDIRLRLVDKDFIAKNLDWEYLNKCQLFFADLVEYSNGGAIYGWHISNLIIYDKPKELSEFYHKCVKMPCEGCEHLKYQMVNSQECDWDCKYLNYQIPLKKPPQSWCYVEELKNE